MRSLAIGHAALLLPVSAVMEVVLDVALMTFVPASHHRCSAPFVDLTSRKCLLASSTTPRCAARVAWWCRVWAKFRIDCIWASSVSALPCWLLCSEESAELSAVPIGTVCRKLSV